MKGTGRGRPLQPDHGQRVVTCISWNSASYDSPSSPSHHQRSPPSPPPPPPPPAPHHPRPAPHRQRQDTREYGRLFACASSRGPPLSLPRSVHLRAEDAKRSLRALSPTSAHPLHARKRPACTPLRQKVQYSCRSTVPNANDWTRQDASHRLLRPLTSSPRQAATQRRPSTRAHPPLRPTPR